MPTLLDLASYVDNLAEEVEEEVSDVSVEVALAVVQSLAYTTPVDTSFALSNWQIGFDVPISADRPAFHEGEGGSTKSASAIATVRDAQKVLSHYIPGQDIYIGNAADYIDALEHGASPQGEFFAEAAHAYGVRLASELTGD